MLAFPALNTQFHLVPFHQHLAEVYANWAKTCYQNSYTINAHYITINNPHILSSHSGIRHLFHKSLWMKISTKYSELNYQLNKIITSHIQPALLYSASCHFCYWCYITPPQKPANVFIFGPHSRNDTAVIRAMLDNVAVGGVAFVSIFTQNIADHGQKLISIVWQSQH